MFKISNIKIPAKFETAPILEYAAKSVGVSKSDIRLFKILKMSVDSRKKPDVYRVVTAVFESDFEQEIIAKGLKNVSPFSQSLYGFPFKNLRSEKRPVVVGFGPGGIMAALCLCEAGLRPVIIERGYDADRRTEDVRKFWDTGILSEKSNVQFGEGGAGMFSDGKLTTGINDERIQYVFSRFVQFGAPEDILYLAKPHIGTDKLKTTIKNIRKYLLSNGCDIHFGTQFTGIVSDGNRLTGIEVKDESGARIIDTDAVLLAPGNSARDTFEMLRDFGIEMQQKSFAVGVRIEHLQKDIDISQYGDAATLGTLPASDYKLAVHLPDGRSVFTFCVCPGGRVVASASESGGVVTNGMSEYARDGKNINGGLLVSVTPDDFDGLFGGIDFQRALERRAYIYGGENYRAPVQLVGDFLKKRPSRNFGRVKPSYKPGVKLANLWDVLPEFICSSIASALPLMEKKIRGFSACDAVLTAVETRSSCPVRIVRGVSGCSSLPGLFPCGEGAGYAGGITSASVDGIKTAENLCLYLNNPLNFPGIY